MKFLKFILFSFLSIMAFDSCSQSLKTPPVQSVAGSVEIIANPLVEMPVVLTNNTNQSWLQIELNHNSIIADPTQVDLLQWIFDDPSITFRNGTTANDETIVVEIPYGIGSEFEFQIHLLDGSFAETEGFLFVDDGTILFPAGTLAYLIPRTRLNYEPIHQMTYEDDSIANLFTINSFALDYEDDGLYEHETPDNPTWTDQLTPGLFNPKYYISDNNIWSEIGEYFTKPIFQIT